MKKLIHILTAEEYRSISNADRDWIHECNDPKHREKYYYQFAYDGNYGLPAVPSKYVWPVFDRAGERFVGKEVAYFIDRAAAEEWRDRENALHSPPPTPPAPHPPYSIGTYYAVETADHWEIRRIVRSIKHRASKKHVRHYGWSEKTISVHDTREEAKRELMRLVLKH